MDFCREGLSVRVFLLWEKTDTCRRQCLNGLPHDDALTPSVDPSISNIVGVNASGSYYDGRRLAIHSTVIRLIIVYLDFVYVHMDLNTRVRRIHSSSSADDQLILHQ